MFNIFEDGFGVHYVASSLDLYPLKLAVFPILHQSHGSTFWMWLCSSNSIMGCTVSFIIMEKIHSSPEKKILWPIITVNACILGKISCQVLGKIIFFSVWIFSTYNMFLSKIINPGSTLVPFQTDFRKSSVLHWNWRTFVGRLLLPIIYAYISCPVQVALDSMTDRRMFELCGSGSKFLRIIYTYISRFSISEPTLWYNAVVSLLCIMLCWKLFFLKYYNDEDSSQSHSATLLYHPYTWI